MISSLYIVLGALLVIKLSFDVIKLRTQYRVTYGDGGFYELQTVIRIHGNAVEYIPISLLLLLIMEMNGAAVWMLHICGILLLAGRLLHYYGLHHRELRWRRMGMIATFMSMIIMIVANIYYLPWEQIFSPYS
ncbi:MAPEG family protein [Xenorhabdus cabanillasii]|uniref:Inner membrane protein yecN n=1 Tax=Xenorhabdus cabanillasii JM26 TaxID=1427517 RepID=W1JCK9_9GAMM|nr:MAPEG family protein [Xenorhabdus cabanillasii]PHM76360.1 membrane protein [Xenorhabdus cabanillasii JM26]CDL87465.1 Inner membrane protein yecN [Xenorhabdus cabanillasii JM26]